MGAGNDKPPISSENVLPKFLPRQQTPDVNVPAGKKLLCAKSLPANSSIKICSGTIGICLGDLTKQAVDAIVVASTSDVLTKNVLQEAGSAVSTQYDTETSSKTQNSIQTNGGNLSCRRIYFIPCENLSKTADKWVFRKFVSEAIAMAVNDQINNIKSIAFPAIGCGLLGCDVNFVAKALIAAVAYELKRQASLQLFVYFIIQQDRQNVFEAFQNQLQTEKPWAAAHVRDVVPKIVAQLNRTPHPSDSNPFEVRRLLVPPATIEYEDVVQRFQLTMSSILYKEIVRIEHIWNRRWYQQYRIHHGEFHKRLSNNTETWLFHGCSETAANNIINECFNRSYAGMHGTLYGMGVYFSSNASFSHTYATPNSKGERCMFLVLVLVGKTTTGNSSMKICPPGFDTTTDGSHIYVTYHDSQAFGKYLITYK
ncbi:unnamed protein product [Rotaria magnacalcarata]|uniref:Poly [ADP-ribose] polymerase n=1 Tax=Rotaria magnacalcarata TaxID=392030 RepID=A0A814RD92_9BILA|nr:unnamed protein product [Rotaria magnacalcarata]